jgi:hypothetical protein
MNNHVICDFYLDGVVVRMGNCRSKRMLGYLGTVSACTTSPLQADEQSQI